MPTSLPAVLSLADRVRMLAGIGNATAEWGLDVRCTNPSCEAAAVEVHAGRVLLDESRGVAEAQVAALDGNGQALFVEQAPSPYGRPRYDADAYGTGDLPDGDDGSEPWGWGVASAGFWSFPHDREVAAGIGATALLAALAYLLWPALKGLPVAGLFSRIAPERVLDHPTRQQILDVVEARPGVHFQELARQVGTGRGSLDHHLQKMLSAGVLVAQEGPGFTCYFPKGRVDWRVMASAPLLKASGARGVLRHILGNPGSSALAVAQALGMAPSTVNYHLKRLQAAGLVEGRREGRFFLVRPTGLAQPALTMAQAEAAA